MSGASTTALPRDREISFALALPALGALAVGPLYVLGDTAIVGHLGTLPLAGLALAGLLLTGILGFCTFLEYGTTARAVRLYGAGRRTEALDVGVQATWLAVLVGLALLAAIEILADPALALLAGGRTDAHGEALSWLRIAALGSPFVLVTAAAIGWLRAFQDTRTPLVVLALANVASIGLSALLVYGAGLGLEGSAVANVVAQACSALVFVGLLVRRGASLAPSLGRMRRQLAAARDLTVRTAAFFAAFTVATSIAARLGDAHVAAQQIGFQLWLLLALILDATAVAAQALVGRLLGAGELAVAVTLARRLVAAGAGLGVAFALLLLAGRDVLPALFSDDAEVIRQVAVLWPWLIAMMPACGVLFALDGVFLGAGDLRFMRNVTVVAALAAYLPISLAAAALDAGLDWLWLGLSAFIWVRLAAGLVRFSRGRWLVGGAGMVDDPA